ncbi:MAG: 3-phosphoshikimate 1-carboxyvinyltransferase [Planctomycetia bacterium]|nr:3-phosphoshikimate 1-carboxyvinyltransferase [Planctomycetia bacterium]MCC7314984.1 3-phosphoshikimate 1-carboxyvinyltransferase [Planctomycetota bacterium]OQZ05965.1 MAG: 3-phosphoshikimate 1-carboxyvinyltransferase [Planctomycetes bacterium UTPLA1]
MNRPDAITLSPPPGPIDCTVHLPGSKSLTNRALLVSALARGTSQLSGVLFSDDTRRMLDALESLGVGLHVDDISCRVRVDSSGGFFPDGQVKLHCGNAGTVMRFLLAACSAGQGEYELDGDPRMRERPIGQLVNALRDLGAQIAYAGAEGYCPLTVHAGRLRAGSVVFDKPVSSQFVSALLMAAPLASGDVMIDVSRGLPSRPYVSMTLSVMEAFGVEVIADGLQRFIVPAPQSYQATSYSVEPDASAASYFFGAAALTGGRVTVEGLGSDSTQGDIGFVKILEQMGCRVDASPRSTTVTGPADRRLRGVDVDLNEMPDVAQTLAVIAAFADGPTCIRNVSNLRVKETDRLFALSAELGRLSVETEVTDDSIVIRPVRSPVAAQVRTYDDHRMAMSFALAGLRVDGVVIEDPGCVSKTFPDFFATWNQLGRKT